MEKLGLNEIRSKFQDFYIKKGHYAAKSASLIPKNDKSLLIINSGMAPLKEYFAGTETPPSKRMTTCQKCIRTGDIDNVGKTSRHGTFFEMLGNFSFGDYFKRESLTWGWEFITEELKMPKDKLWATVYQDDDEAYEIWKELGMPEERIVRLGKEDNFWEIGLGPCGPCSEIYFDRGPEFGCGNEDCKPGCECDRYIEFWNHVFTQFSKEADGSYSNLKHPNIDTGMGLERIACIMQNVDSIFDVDTIRHTVNAVCTLAGIKYENGNISNDMSVRIITDHLRSITFMISDGILPSNEGRGYVLRRLIRRAYRHGKMLGINGNFLCDLVDSVIEISKNAYPELLEKRDYIKKILSIEEDKFNKTLDSGLNILNEYIREIKKSNDKVLDGERAFKLYDTYGFPVEMTEEILAEQDIGVDLEVFNKCMQNQKSLARKGRKSTENEAWKNSLEYGNIEKTIFTGYDELTTDAKLIYSGDYTYDERMLIFDKTPFYPTGGGQINDIGEIEVGDRKVRVKDVIKEDGIIIHIIAPEFYNEAKAISVGSKARLKVDKVRRHKIARGHSATHLLHKALKTVLGDHVVQAGSYVCDEYFRFDFNHFEPMTQDQIDDVQLIINEKIDEFIPISSKEMNISDAKKLGATAIFGEKYGNIVRVVKMGDFSLEFCGGTHLSNTGMIGAFKVISESGIASGIRRIEAVVGTGVWQKLELKEDSLSDIEDLLKVKESDIFHKIDQIISQNKEYEKEIKKFKNLKISASMDELISSAKIVGENKIKFITYKFNDVEVDALRHLCDDIKSKSDSCVILLSTVNAGKAAFILSITEDLINMGLNAGKILKEGVKIAKGGGGGKPSLAQAGAKDLSKIDDVFLKVEEIIGG